MLKMKAKYIFSPSLFETLAISDGGQMWMMLPNMLFGTFCSYLIGSYVIFEVWKWWSWWKRETDYIIFSLDNLDLSRAEEMRFIEEGLCVIVFEISGHFQQDQTFNLRFLNFVIVFIQFCFANMICAFSIQTNHIPQHGPEWEHIQQRCFSVIPYITFYI